MTPEQKLEKLRQLAKFYYDHARVLERRNLVGDDIAVDVYRYVAYDIEHIVNWVDAPTSDEGLPVVDFDAPDPDLQLALDFVKGHE